MMGSFWFLIMVVAFMASPSLSLSTELKLDNSTNAIFSAAPALLPDPPQSSPPGITELSPDISPLLPSPGGALPSPTGSSIPTIPSNPSPPNPDEVVSLGPGSAASSPFGSELTSSSSSLSLFGFLNFAVLMGLMLFW